MTVEFHRVTESLAKLIQKHPEFFTNVKTTKDILYGYVEDFDVNKGFGYLNEYGEVVIPAGTSFKVEKPYILGAYFNITKNDVSLDINYLDELSFIVELSSVGALVYQCAKENDIPYLEALENIIYYAKLLGVSLDNYQ